MAEMRKTRGIALPHLIAWRKKRLMTQRDLAAVSGVSQSSITQLETGEHTARVATVRKLAEALNVTTDDLLRDPEDKSIVPAVVTSGHKRQRGTSTTPAASA